MGANAGALVNVGAIRNGVFEYTFDKIQTKSDNAGVIRESASNEQAAFSADLMEVNFTNLGSFYAGVLTAAAVVGAPVAITDEVHVLTGTTETVLTHQMGAGTEVGSIVVKNAAGTTTLRRDCDYTVNVNSNGSTSIARTFPKIICSALADVAVNNAGTYTTAGGTFISGLAVGDHIIVAGCTTPADNGVKTVTAVTGTVITVSEVCSTTAASASTTITRGGIASGDTTLTSYSYTPSTGKTLKGGGLTTFTARYCRFTNTNDAGLTLVLDIFSATPDGGITVNFPADDAEDPAVCPIKMVGKCDTTLTAGEQLFVITDSQHTT
jgi:hypothetical protein